MRQLADECLNCMLNAVRYIVVQQLVSMLRYALEALSNTPTPRFSSLSYVVHGYFTLQASNAYVNASSSCQPSWMILSCAI